MTDASCPGVFHAGQVVPRVERIDGCEIAAAGMAEIFSRRTVLRLAHPSLSDSSALVQARYTLVDEKPNSKVVSIVEIVR